MVRSVVTFPRGPLPNKRRPHHIPSAQLKRLARLVLRRAMTVAEAPPPCPGDHTQAAARPPRSQGAPVPSEVLFTIINLILCERVHENDMDSTGRGRAVAWGTTPNVHISVNDGPGIILLELALPKSVLLRNGRNSDDRNTWKSDEDQCGSMINDDCVVVEQWKIKFTPSSKSVDGEEDEEDVDGCDWKSTSSHGCGGEGDKHGEGLSLLKKMLLSHLKLGKMTFWLNHMDYTRHLRYRISRESTHVHEGGNADDGDETASEPPSGMQYQRFKAVHLNCGIIQTEATYTDKCTRNVEDEQTQSRALHERIASEAPGPTTMPRAPPKAKLEPGLRPLSLSRAAGTQEERGVLQRRVFAHPGSPDPRKQQPAFAWPASTTPSDLLGDSAKASRSLGRIIPDQPHQDSAEQRRSDSADTAENGPSCSLGVATPAETFLLETKAQPGRTLPVNVRRKPRRRTSSLGASGSSLETSLLGSYEESLLKGRMSSAPRLVEGFVLELAVTSSNREDGKHYSRMSIPFDAMFYPSQGSGERPSPYCGLVNLEEAIKDNYYGFYRVPDAGLLKVVIKNPNGTHVKLFLVKYDNTGMDPKTKMLLRQRIHPQGIDECDRDKPGTVPPSAIHLRFLKTNRSLFLATEIRVVFNHRCPDEERARVVYEATPPMALTASDKAAYRYAKSMRNNCH